MNNIFTIHVIDIVCCFHIILLFLVISCKAAYRYGFSVIFTEIDLRLRQYGNCPCITEISISDFSLVYTSKNCDT